MTRSSHSKIMQNRTTVVKKSYTATSAPSKAKKTKANLADTVKYLSKRPHKHYDNLDALMSSKEEQPQMFDDITLRENDTKPPSR